MFPITKLDTMGNDHVQQLAARHTCMTAINYTAEFLQPEASAFAHSREICLV
jgi:hypothetical protein